MRTLIIRSLLLSITIATLCGVAGAAGPKGKDLRRDRRDIRSDTRDIRHDRRDIRLAQDRLAGVSSPHRRNELVVSAENPAGRR